MIFILLNFWIAECNILYLASSLKILIIIETTNASEIQAQTREDGPLWEQINQWYNQNEFDAFH